MRLLEELGRRNDGRSDPFLIGSAQHLTFAEVADTTAERDAALDSILPGDVVALIGDFDRRSIATMLRLLDRGVVLMPLATGTEANHEYFFDAGCVEWVIREGVAERRMLRSDPAPNELIGEIRRRGNPGIVFFSSGTTGRPKAILHDFTSFLARYETPRPALRTLNFLLFDHAGGINTLLHTLFNRGVVVVPSDRTPELVASEMISNRVELLPATPTFLRMMLLAGMFNDHSYPDLKVVTYGTERMDQGTLYRLGAALPHVDLRQTYGLSELGVFQVKSRARDSLWMQIGGKGLETRIVDGVLHIRSVNRMLGYLNAPSPFLEGGWYDTGDIVEEEDGFIRIVGRTNEIMNVGGLKVLPGEIERVAFLHPGVLRAKAVGVSNPITGQHIEVTCEPETGVVLDRRELMSHFREHLQKQLCPHKVTIGRVSVSHRFKQK